MGSENKRVAFHTLGCKLNFSETSTLARKFEENGFSRVEPEESPDVVVINTCSVTENADKDCRYLVRKTLTHSPNAFVAVTGCYAQLKPDEIAEIPGVDAVLGASEKFNLFEHIEALSSARGGSASGGRNGKAKVFATPIKEVTQFNSSFSIGDRTRSFLKVQDGCDYFCSFCTIPLARGRSRSDTIENIVKQAEEIAVKGIKEVVLTGVNIGDFGRGQNPVSNIRNPTSGIRHPETFVVLVEQLEKVQCIERFRISSIEPNLLTDEIIDFVATSKRFAPHFHIPLQSGSNKILTLMRRKYSRELYAERVNRIKFQMPHCCIGADVIVGFPGETEDDFLDTYKFLNELDVSYLHVFSYSERENTTAFKMNEVIHKEERHRRSKILQNLSFKKRRKFYEDNLGKERPVLIEQDEENGRMFGFTDNYIRVNLPHDSGLPGKIVMASLDEIGNDGTVRGVMTFHFELLPTL